MKTKETIHIQTSNHTGCNSAVFSLLVIVCIARVAISQTGTAYTRLTFLIAFQLQLSLYFSDTVVSIVRTALYFEKRATESSLQYGG